VVLASKQSVVGHGAGRWIAAGVLTVAVCLIWLFAYGVTEGFSAEYGSSGEWAGGVPVAVVVGGVIGMLSRPVLARFGVRRRKVGAVGVGVVVAIGVVVASAAGQSAGGARHDRRQRAIAESCADGADETTLGFARKAGRIIPTNGASTYHSENVCAVTIAVEKGLDDDPLDAIDEAVSDDGWRRRGRSTWLGPDGFRVVARVEQAQPDEAEHSVELFGSPP
jgi:hypothetical protein